MGSLLVRDGGLVVRDGTLVRKESIAECECCPTCSACSGGVASFATVTISQVADPDPRSCFFLATECNDFFNKEWEMPLIGVEGQCVSSPEVFCSWRFPIGGGASPKWCVTYPMEFMVLRAINDTLGEYTLLLEIGFFNIGPFGGEIPVWRMLFETSQAAPFDCSAGTYVLPQTFTQRACFTDVINQSLCDFSDAIVSVTFG